MARVSAAVVLSLTLALASSAGAADPRPGLTKGRPDIRSLSALAFGPEGVLFVGDSKGGGVFAIDLGPREAREIKEPKEVTDVEGKLAALLGAAPSTSSSTTSPSTRSRSRPTSPCPAAAPAGAGSGCCPTTWPTPACSCASTAAGWPEADDLIAVSLRTGGPA